jgi:hypothetical protein
VRICVRRADSLRYCWMMVGLRCVCLPDGWEGRLAGMIRVRPGWVAVRDALAGGGRSPEDPASDATGRAPGTMVRRASRGDRPCCAR